jgi:hypothetical protein
MNPGRNLAQIDARLENIEQLLKEVAAGSKLPSEKLNVNTAFEVTPGFPLQQVLDSESFSPSALKTVSIDVIAEYFKCTHPMIHCILNALNSGKRVYSTQHSIVSSSSTISDRYELDEQI